MWKLCCGKVPLPTKIKSNNPLHGWQHGAQTLGRLHRRGEVRADGLREGRQDSPTSGEPGLTGEQEDVQGRETPAVRPREGIKHGVPSAQPRKGGRVTIRRTVTTGDNYGGRERGQPWLG